jgi:hypothetical protein
MPTIFLPNAHIGLAQHGSTAPEGTEPAMYDNNWRR